MGRANYRLAHWMRAILPTIDLSDLPLTGFMPLPGSGELEADGSNAAYDWGEPEPIRRHMPQQLAALGTKRGRGASAKGGPKKICRAIVGPPRHRKRCSNTAHVGPAEPGWLEGTCHVHKTSGMFELRPGETWSAAADEAATEADDLETDENTGPIEIDADDLAALEDAGIKIDLGDEEEEGLAEEEDLAKE